MEHQVQQPPALFIAEHRGKKGVVYAAAKESRAYDCSKSGANRQPAGTVHQTESCITADKGMKPLLIAGRGVFAARNHARARGQGHIKVIFKVRLPTEGAFSLPRTVVTKNFLENLEKLLKND